jgi:hypothetical protein
MNKRPWVCPFTEQRVREIVREELAKYADGVLAFRCDHSCPHSEACKAVHTVGVECKAHPPAIPRKVIDGVALPGQWWERQGYVVFLHPAMNPNDDSFFTGWRKVTEAEARAVLAGVDSAREPQGEPRG